MKKGQISYIASRRIITSYIENLLKYEDDEDYKIIIGMVCKHFAKIKKHEKENRISKAKIYNGRTKAL